MSTPYDPVDPVGGSSSTPPASSPPTTTGGGTIIRLDVPSTANQGSQIQRRCQYNCSDDNRIIHVGGEVRVYRATDFAWFYGLCPPEAALGTNGLAASSNLVGFIAMGDTLSFVCKGQQTVLGTIGASDWYKFGLSVGPHRSSVVAYYGQQEQLFRQTLPDAVVGLGLTLCAVNLDSSRAFAELRGASAFQLTG